MGGWIEKKEVIYMERDELFSFNQSHRVTFNTKNVEFFKSRKVGCWIGQLDGQVPGVKGLKVLMQPAQD